MQAFFLKELFAYLWQDNDIPMRTIKIFFPFLTILVMIFFSSCNKPDGSTITEVTITSLKPAHGPYDTIDTLIGKGFDQIPQLDSILLNGKKLTLISRRPNQVVVKIPSMAGTGKIDVWYQGNVIHGPVFSYDSTFLVTTVAGSSTEAGYINGQGLNARFKEPEGIAVDKTGNIYVSDKGNNCIRKITQDGNVTTFAGSVDALNGYVDATGSSARFSAPLGLCIDNNEILYVADQFNHRVRKVSKAGDVTTLAGITWNTAPDGGQIDGDASVATFNTPFDITADSHSNVYVADFYNNKIRKITSSGTVSTIAGGDYYHYGHQDGDATTSLFSTPAFVAADPSGNIYAIDGDGHLLRKITSTGTVSTLLGPIEPGMEGISGLFFARGLTTDKTGNVYFGISTGVIKMTPEGKVIRLAVGGIGELDGPVQVATYRAIAGIAVDDNGNIYITDNNRVRKIAWQ
jgi:hypothetical protein